MTNASRVRYAASAAVLAVAVALALPWSPGRTAPESFRQFEGLYEFSGGERVVVGHIEELDGPVTANFTTGRLRAFHPQAANVFVAGPTLGAATPVDATISFAPGHVDWRETGAVRNGERVPFRSEEVSFRNGDVTLAGSLLLPPGKGPFPAVVLAHGGGGADRNFFFVPEFFAMRGVAVLAYDKRGVGHSTGDWQRASHRELATDLVAAIDFLRTRADIDKAKIGLYGSSEGGWTAPIAATIAGSKVKWLIVRSASGLDDRQNVLYEIESDLRDHGFGDDVVAKVMALHRRDYEATLSNGAGWNELRDELAKASAEPWFQYARLPAHIIELNDANRGRVMSWFADARRHWGEDPARIWELVTCPVLMQIGEIDRNVPAKISAEVIGAALKRAHNGDATIKVYPRGDHGIFESTNGYQSDISGVTRYVPGYLDDLGHWIDAHAK